MIGQYSLAVRILVVIGTWLASALLAYGMLKQDIAVLKAQREDDLRFITQQLEDIKNTQSRILYKIENERSYTANNR